MTVDVLVTGAGGAPTLGVTRALKMVGGYHVVGVDCNEFKAQLSETEKCFLAPMSKHDPTGFIQRLKQIVCDERVDFLHAQPWCDVKTVSEYRDELGAKTFLPSKESVRNCTNKWLSYHLWAEAGLKVPDTRRVESYTDILEAVKKHGSVWLRADEGAAGVGSFSTSDVEKAKLWVDLHSGWGHFTVAEYLSPRSTTWMSLWRDGELIVAQGRERLYWEYGGRFLSGVSGVTGACKTISDPVIDKLALDAVYAIDKKPNGVWSVDMTYDKDGEPNLTEVNIGKFFTTSFFFTKAGLNFPAMYLRLGLGETVEPIGVNPLPPGLVWIRGMDSEPVLTSMSKIEGRINKV